MYNVPMQQRVALSAWIIVHLKRGGSRFLVGHYRQKVSQVKPKNDLLINGRRTIRPFIYIAERPPQLPFR